MKKWYQVLGKVFLIIAITLGSLNLIVAGGVAVLKKVMGGEVPYVVDGALKTLSYPNSNKKVKEFKQMMGGTALGVCHPQNDAYNIGLLKDANIGWVRFDLPGEIPFEYDASGYPIKDKDGNYILNQYYVNFKNRCKIFQDQGVKVMTITPYPDDVLDQLGEISVFETGGEFSEKFKTVVKEMSKFYANDLQGYVNCFQISNELTIDKWQGALTTDQVCYYQGELQMKEMHDITYKAGIPIGFNMCGYTLYNYPKQICDTYGDYFDYIALDLYLGCFEDQYKTTAIYDLLLRHFYDLSGHKPVMLNEFGYISAGTQMNDEERLQYLNDTFGEEFNTEEKIRNNLVSFLDKFDEVSDEKDGSPLTREARRLILAEGVEAAANYFLGSEQIAHLYKSLPDGYQLANYEHTQEDQAKFFKDTISRLSMLDFICGYFVYMWSDSDECYQCGQDNCPVETGWGLVSLKPLQSGESYSETTVVKKPSYYAIQEVFGKISKKNKKY